MTDPLVIADATFSSRLIVGTARYPNQQVMLDCLEASGAELVTASIRRISLEGYAESLVDVLGGRLRNVLLIGPSQSYELPEQPFKAGYCVIYLVKGRLACRRLRPQASHQIKMRPQYRQWRSHLMRGIGGESAHQFNGQIQPLQQGIYRERRC